VILRILAQESLDLELWLKRYEFLKFGAIFVDFSEARDLFVNIFQIHGPNYKFLDCGLMLEKQRGFFTKWQGISARIYFSMDKSVDRVHASVDRPGALDAPWCDGGADRGGAGARWCAHRSSAFGHSGAPNPTGGGAIERGAHGELV
jgi:hypothetical protein